MILINFIFITILYALVNPSYANIGVISTVAGIGGSYGFSGNGGPATSAQLSFPYGLYVDSSGNMYIADTDNCVIRKVGMNGIINTVAGVGRFSFGLRFHGDGGPATSAKLTSPSGLYVDSSGIMYIVDYGNSVIRKVDGNGIITSVAGIGDSPGFSGDGGPATSAQLSSPYSVHVDSLENMYIADFGNCVIRKVGGNGLITTVAGIGESPGFSGDGGPATSALLTSPSGVFVDSLGNIYIADSGNAVIRKVSGNGVITTVAGIGGSDGYSGDGGPATSARLSTPYGVYFDSLGNMYFAEMRNRVIRKVSGNGVITTVAGIGGSDGFSGDGGPATSAQLSFPYGLYVDLSGNIYIADSGNAVIRYVSGGTVAPTTAPTSTPTAEPTAEPTVIAQQFGNLYDSSTLGGYQLYVLQFGTSGNEDVNSVAVDSSSGSVYVGGLTTGSFPGFYNLGGNDVFIRKYSIDGNIQYTIQDGSSASEQLNGLSINSGNGDVFDGGSTMGTLPGQFNSGGLDAYLRKYDSNGNLEFTRQFGTVGNDITHNVAVDSSNGNVLVCGYTTASFPGLTNLGSSDAYMRVYDGNGNELFTRQFGTDSNDFANDVAVDTSSHSAYFVGFTSGSFTGFSNIGGYDSFIRKYSSTGNEIFTRQFGTSGHDFANCVTVDSNNGYFIVAGDTTGSFSGYANQGSNDAFFRKYDSSGNELFTRQFGTSMADYLYGISVDSSSGSIYVGGQTAGSFPGFTNQGGNDAYIRKYDNSGNELFTRQFGTSGDDIIYCGVAFDSSSGNVYAIGHTTGSFTGYSNEGLYDALIVKLEYLEPTSQPSRQPSRQPTGQPSIQPTGQPTGQPAIQPTNYPSNQPSIQPTTQPSSNPSNPSSQPTMKPSTQPFSKPTIQPTIQPTHQPSIQPSRQPSKYPSSQPSVLPTAQPVSKPSRQPSIQPSNEPSRQPSCNPTLQPANKPSTQPSSQPSYQPSIQPTSQPSYLPSAQPTSQPSIRPTSQPSYLPSAQPVCRPTNQPSMQPSHSPSVQPSRNPTIKPSSRPSMRPTIQPSKQPSVCPSQQPSPQPSRQPSFHPFNLPTTQPTNKPSKQPTLRPSRKPTCQPNNNPSSQPSLQPSLQPTSQPSTQPRCRPTRKPTSQPTYQPTISPSCQPTRQPTSQPSSQPQNKPVGQPSTIPSNQPSIQPSRSPINKPSSQPSVSPTDAPISRCPTRPGETNPPTSRPSSSHPTRQPITKPSSQPSRQPSRQPTTQPSTQPLSRPTSQPTYQPSIQPTNQPDSEPTCRPSQQPFIRPTSQPTQQPFVYPSVCPSSQPSFQPTIQPSKQPSTRPSMKPSHEPSAQPSQQPSIVPSIQPTSQPSNPSSQPSMLPSSQPSSAPSLSAVAFENQWTIKINRFDDFFDPAIISDITSLDWDYYCTNSNWRTSSPALNCTLRLALYYCLFSMPWDNPLLSCRILYPPYATLFLSVGFSFYENRFQNNFATRIIIDFQGSRIVVSDKLSLSLISSKKVDLIFMNIYFETNYTKSSSVSALFELSAINKVFIEDCTLDGVSLSVTNLNKVVISNSVIRDVQFSSAFTARGVSMVEIYNTTFYFNHFGSSVLVDSCIDVILAFSRFINSKSEVGSAVYKHKVDTSNVYMNQFVSNRASITGTLFWVFGYMLAPSMVSNIWLNNSAGFYGDTVSSSFCGEDCLIVSPSSMNYIDYTNISLPFFIRVSVLDYYGSLMTSKKGQIKVYANQELSNCRGVIGSYVVRHDAFVVDKARSAFFKVFDLNLGEALLSDVGVICLPSGNMTVTIELTLSVPSAVLHINEEVVYRQGVSISFRNCRRGEIFDLTSVTQSTCSLCDNSYSLNENKDFRFVSTKCQICPVNALTCSGDQIILKPGTWRLNPQSLDIFTCPSQFACLGGNGTGEECCRTGHSGRMCGVCEQGYFLSSRASCEKCSSRLSPLLTTGVSLIVLFLLIGACYWRFRSTIDEYLFDDFFKAVLSKLVFTYQIILLGIGNFLSFKLFKFYYRLVDVFRFINLDFGSLLSISCFTEYNFYTSLRLYILTPIIVGLIIISMALLSRTPREKNKCYTALVSMLYFFIPLVSSISLQTYNCISVGSEAFLVSDLSIICSGASYEYHKKWAFFGFCLYMIVFPIFCCYILYVRRHLIAHPLVMKKYFSFVNNPDFSDIKISTYFSLLSPFEGLFIRYKPRYWWYDIFNIYTSVFLTSIIGSLCPIENQRVLVSILSLFIINIVEGKTEPYEHTLENILSYFTTFQLLVIFISMYIRMNNTLGSKEDNYQNLDVFLVIFQVLVLSLATHLLVVYFRKKKKEKSSKSNDVSIDQQVKVSLTKAEYILEERKRELYSSYFGRSFIIEAAPDVLLKDLLRVQGVLFLRLAPIGTYESICYRNTDVGNIISSLHYTHDLPLNFNNNSSNNIIRNNKLSSNSCDITIFSQERKRKEFLSSIWLQAGLTGFLVNIGLVLKYKNSRHSNIK